MNGDVMQYALTVLGEIKIEIEAGRIPSTCATFSELHDYVDANDFLDGTVPDLPDLPDGTTDFSLINAVTDAVDAFLQAAVHGVKRQHVLAVGDPIRGLTFFGPYAAEQAADVASRFTKPTWIAPMREEHERLAEH